MTQQQNTREVVMKTVEEKIAVMQAYLAGKPIERSENGSEICMLEDDPTWDWEHYDYQVVEDGFSIDRAKHHHYWLTRGGDRVRIYATDSGGDRPVHGAVRQDDRWLIAAWDKKGRYDTTGVQRLSDIIRKA